MNQDSGTSEAQIAFNDIWNHHPELQNRTSSSWWFFLLFPYSEKTGYGPKQLMFSFASRMGDEIKVNHVWQKGMKLNRSKGAIDQFMTTVVGWANDGKGKSEEIIHQPAMAKLSYHKQYLDARNTDEDGNTYGGKIEAINDHGFAMKAYFEDKNGYANFKIWNQSDHELEIPHIVDFRGPRNGAMGNTHLVAWRKMRFEGEFKGLNDIEHLEGFGYFQRVLMNVPMFPWKWPFILFKDSSVFSSFIPYIGMQLFRREYKFYPQEIERMVFPLTATAYYYDQKTGITTYFEHANVYPVINGQKNPDFNIIAKSNTGDFMKIKVKSHGHSQFLLDRRVIKRLWQTKYNYNEYMIKVVGIKGRINGKLVDYSKHGPGFGNIEYTWGLSL